MYESDLYGISTCVGWWSSRRHLRFSRSTSKRNTFIGGNATTSSAANTWRELIVLIGAAPSPQILHLPVSTFFSPPQEKINHQLQIPNKWKHKKKILTQKIHYKKITTNSQMNHPKLLPLHVINQYCTTKKRKPENQSVHCSWCSWCSWCSHEPSIHILFLKNVHMV